MDEAFTDEELGGMSGMQAMRDRVMRVIGRNPTVRDFLEVTRRGRPRPAPSCMNTVSMVLALARP